MNCSTTRAGASLLLVEAHIHLRTLPRQQGLLVELVHVHITMLQVMRAGHGLARDLWKEMIGLVRSCIREECREAGSQSTRMCTLMAIGKARCVVVAVLARQVC